MNFLAKGVNNIKTCANQTCNKLFTPTRHNQKYCSKDCCTIVTNAKSKRLYHENQARKKGKVRICKECNVTRLSRYNEGDTCQMCAAAEVSDIRFSLLQLVGAA